MKLDNVIKDQDNLNSSLYATDITKESEEFKLLKQIYQEVKNISNKLNNKNQTYETVDMEKLSNTIYDVVSPRNYGGKIVIQFKEYIKPEMVTHISNNLKLQNAPYGEKRFLVKLDQIDTLNNTLQELFK